MIMNPRPTFAACEKNSRPTLIKFAFAETIRRAMKMRDVSGTALIEFAFVMPLLMMMLVGMFMFGITIHDYISVTGAAEAGMLQLTVSRGSTTSWTNTTNVIYAAAPTLLRANLTVSVSVNGTACTSDATCVTAMSTAAGARLRDRALSLQAESAEPASTGSVDEQRLL